MSQRALKKEIRLANEKRTRCNAAIHCLVECDLISFDYGRKLRNVVSAEHDARIATAHDNYENRKKGQP